MQECHSVFFKQVTNWVLFGQLTDKFEEFFIKAVQEPSGEAAESVVSLNRFRLFLTYCDSSLKV